MRPGPAAAAAALALPIAATVAGPAAAAVASVLSVLLGVVVVLGAGWPGHRSALRALRSATVTADAGVSVATLTATIWSVVVLLPAAGIVLAGPLSGGASPDVSAQVGLPGGDDLLGLVGGPALLPGAAAVLTAVAAAVRCTGRHGRSSGDGPGLLGRIRRPWGRPRSRSHTSDAREVPEDGPHKIEPISCAARGPGSAGLRVAADRWSAGLVPAAVLVAMAVIGFRAGAGAAWTTAVPAGLAVLLAACPVALLGAVPSAVRAADRAGGSRIRLPLPSAGATPDDTSIRTGRPGWQDPIGWTDPLGAPRPVDRVDTVVLAGPDVLTGPAPGRVTVHPVRGEDPETVLRLASSLAGTAGPGSDLAPLARALAATAPPGLPDVAEADETPAMGLSGLIAELVPAAPTGPASAAEQVDGAEQSGVAVAARARMTVVAHAVLLGSPGWLAAHGIALPPGPDAERRHAEAEGRAVAAIAWDGSARAVLTRDRPPHPDAASGVARLRAAGVAPVLLTPDDPGAAHALGVATGLDPADPDSVRPGLDSAGRAAAVAGMQVRGRTVAVAASPGADAVALARADLAIALTPWPDDGTDPVPAPPEESARIAVRGGPGDVAAALLLARRARAHARAGLTTAAVVAVLGVVAAVAGLPAVPAAAVPVLAAVTVRSRRIVIR